MLQSWVFVILQDMHRAHRPRLTESRQPCGSGWAGAGQRWHSGELPARIIKTSGACSWLDYALDADSSMHDRLSILSKQQRQIEA